MARDFSFKDAKQQINFIKTISKSLTKVSNYQNEKAHSKECAHKDYFRSNLTSLFNASNTYGVFGLISPLIYFNIV